MENRELSCRAAAHLAPGRDPPARITDKMLSNFRYVGLIHKLFPRASIIHTYRNPIDTCMSCFSINFASQPFTFDLGELGDAAVARLLGATHATLRPQASAAPAS